MIEQSRWNFSFLLDTTPFGDSTYLNWLLAGLAITLVLTLFSWIIAFTIGSLFGILRTLPNKWCSFIGASYVALFRNVPLLVQFVIWIEVIPSLLPDLLRDWCFDHSFFSVLIFACICLGLFTGARICEQIKAAIEALPKGQTYAALALGLTRPQTYRYIILPRAYRIVLPPMTSELLNMVKNTAVASLVGVHELSSQAAKMQEFTSHPYEAFIIITLIYVIINVGLMQLMRLIEKRIKLTRVKEA